MIIWQQELCCGYGLALAQYQGTGPSEAATDLQWRDPVGVMAPHQWEATAWTERVGEALGGWGLPPPGLFIFFFVCFVEQ
ncbi:hypothetical protein AOXY_G6286 [Acipenser oxyrinchus oxyrinchus]|uniref:Uncharacterized protein n=1 Tax=Acipenser oxyrinchus oxyrinchus TaxID=40147 RepID=A0AAD8LPI5_ACIOX|nr:hypothetical protein AOXY_G6286 [Acipenser oxyrinchus oxyrinchus]